jgi:uncharacterized protein RhaS with RHS repeats
MGRFLQPDPKHFAAGDYNLYRYCHNDPVNKSDPLGLAPIDVSAEEDAQAQEGLTRNHQHMIDNQGFLGWHPWEYSTTVFRDGNGHLSLSPTQTDNSDHEVHPPERDGLKAVIETHNHALDIPFNRITDSLLSERDVLRGNQTGRAQYAVSIDGKTRMRFRPDDDRARRERSPKDAGGAIEKLIGGHWVPAPGANTDLNHPHGGKNWPYSQ